MKLDLHVHSTASDGACAPAEVVSIAAAGGLDVLALADHDTVAGVDDARAAGRKHAVQIIPAIEMSSTWKGRELHILGYFVDTEAPGVLRHQERASSRRVERMGQMIDRLRGLGIEVDMDEVLEVAGPERFSVGRPHLAKALLRSGHVRSVEDAFDRLIGDAHEAYVPTDLLGPVEAIACIRGSGGIAVWAHPPADLIPRFLPELTRGGLRGLEVYRPRSRPDAVLALERQARRYGLLVTGGSDWHDPQAGPALGEFFVTAEEVAELLEEGGL
jgi:3',5'-nucleoside bisphosphate phosphatase